ncbi:MAG: RT0821/Lpp0805 family surface protein [Pseudomonadota bacterium]
MCSALYKASRYATIATVLAALGGCAVGTSAIDDSISTSALSLADATPTIASDPFIERDPSDGLATDRLLDEDTMRLAVTTADLNAPLPNGVPWANASTGATGVIRTITQAEIDGQTCRAFTATRRAYDGVSLYRGEVCLDRRTGWWTKTLAEVS